MEWLWLVAGSLALLGGSMALVAGTFVCRGGHSSARQVRTIRHRRCELLRLPGQGKSCTVAWTADGHAGLVIDGTNNEEPRLSQNIGAPLAERQLEALGLVWA
jgi:hypothetical protein